jgi:hypothetical protein
MKDVLASSSTTAKRWWWFLGYVMAVATAVWILSTSACEGPDEGGSGNPSHIHDTDRESHR